MRSLRGISIWLPVLQASYMEAKGELDREAKLLEIAKRETQMKQSEVERQVWIVSG